MVGEENHQGGGRAGDVEDWIGQAGVWAVALGAWLSARAGPWPAFALLAAAALLLSLPVIAELRRHRRAPAAPGERDSGRARARALATARADGAARAAAVVADLLAALRAARRDDGAQERAERVEELGGNLTLAAVTLIGLARGWSKSARAIEPALAALRRADTAPAREVLRAMAAAMVRKDGGEAVPSALLIRHLAALTFIHEPAVALEPARWLVDHGPDAPETWSLLGIVAREAGELQQARAACEKVLSLAVRTSDRALSAGALGTLGEIHQAFGNLDRAEEYFRIALTYQAGLERPKAMVRNYRCLAQVYETRHDWPRAAETLAKALALGDAPDDREGAADLEVRAGRVARYRGLVGEACAHWARARQVFDELGWAEKVAELDGWMADAFKGAPPP